jgi:hypothetical protein
VPTDQEIRDICVRVTLAANAEQFKASLTELKIALREHISDAQNLGIHLLLNKPKAVQERKDGTND